MTKELKEILDDIIGMAEQYGFELTIAYNPGTLWHGRVAYSLIDGYAANGPDRWVFPAMQESMRSYVQNIVIKPKIEK